MGFRFVKVWECVRLNIRKEDIYKNKTNSNYNSIKIKFWG